MLPPSTQTTLNALRRGDLAGAREVRLPGGLSEVPDEIFGLADTLEVLDLSGGTLSALPVDFGRLRRLRVLFCSGNRFDRLPPVLGDCPALSQIGFRGASVRVVPEEALPVGLRWLTLTDNAIEHLPRSLGQRPLLQKLMLSGNRLRALPDDLAGASNLELVRLAANGFEALPPWLASLPRLAWVSFAGNLCETPVVPAHADAIRWCDLSLGDLLGEGASGRVHHAVWHPSHQPVALKLFKGAITSDGLPASEMSACLAAGSHPHLTGAIGRLADAPNGAEGLIMPLLPAHWRVLAGPPSLESCSRDIYDPSMHLGAATAWRLGRALAVAITHLHERQILHGDVYAHNLLWDGNAGNAVLSDFGAASGLPPGPEGQALQRVESRAYGLLLGELLARCDVEIPPLRAIETACVDLDVTARPLMRDVAAVVIDLARQ